MHLHGSGMCYEDTASRLGVSVEVVIATVHPTGMTEQQRVDYSIVMGLSTTESIQEWMSAVGPADVRYGLSLLECAGLEALWRETTDGPFTEAINVIRSVVYDK